MNKIFKNINLCSINVILICSALVIGVSGFTYNQIKIPLDNEKGVPYSKIIKNKLYCIEGFDVDENGNFYFLGGGYNAALVCFADTNLKYKRKYNDFYSGEIYIKDDKLYLFDLAYKKSSSQLSNSLYILNKVNGDIINKFPNIVNNKINSYLFNDSTLILEIFDNTKDISTSTSLAFALFSLSGKFIKQVNNRFNLPEYLYPEDFVKNAIDYIGEWNNGYIFSGYNVDKGTYIYSLNNKQGKQIAVANIDDKLFGKSVIRGAFNHNILRNGNIYILGHEGTNAVVTILPVKDLFDIPVKADSIK